MRDALLALAFFLTGCAASPPVAERPKPDPVKQIASLRNQQRPADASQVADGLSSADGRVQYFALLAATDKSQEEKVRRELLRLSGSQHAYQAIPALELLSDQDRYSLDDGVASAFYHALDHPDPAVIVRALDRMGTEAESLSARPGFYEKVLSLTGHQSAYVRGMAVELTPHMVAPSEEASLKSLLRGKLKDSSPYVRSKAAAALAELEDKSAIPELVKLLDDPSPSQVQTSYVDLMGDEVPLEDSGSTWSRVDDAALAALDFLGVFDYGQVDPDHRDQDIRQEADRARRALANR